jgi:4-amino-4-deoxy-L-arabinose transferase-like glycosyltransferase
MAPACYNQTRRKTLGREVILVGLLSLSAAVLRAWGLPRLGLSHFDEGIYALAGLYSMMPGGLEHLDPALVPYAPAGFPILVGISYVGLGVSDVAAILVSIFAGTLTVPASAWLARRTCGAGAGAAAAALVAFSGVHITFSRLALTDVSFLLCWVLGLVCGQRFLERPGFASAFALGLSVGLAQWFKYVGWLIGAFVILSLCLGILADPKERRRSRVQACCAFGLLAALLACAMYWPWFAFVESHGGYAALLAHHQGYMKGIGSWLPHLRLQLQQMTALSGGLAWNLTEYLAALLSCQLVIHASAFPIRHRGILLAILALVFLVFPFFYWLLGAAWILDPRQWRSAGTRLLAAAWIGLTILTPFYHPYARLWLPLHFLGWITTAGLIAQVLGNRGQYISEPVFTSHSNYTISHNKISYIMYICILLVLVYPNLRGQRWPTVGPAELPGPLANSDSLRSAVGKAIADLPAGTPGLRLLARPPVLFYLDGRVPAQVEPDLARLITPADPRVWALVDLAQLRQEAQLEAATAELLGRWELVHEYPAELSLAALLDIDPGAASAGRSESTRAPIWLLRPRTIGPTR